MLFVHKRLFISPNLKKRFANFASDPHYFSPVLTCPFVLIIIIISKCFLLGLMLYIILIPRHSIYFYIRFLVKALEHIA